MKVWERRIGCGFNESVVEAFNASISEDWFLWKEEIEVSLAYAQGLGKAGIISSVELSIIETGLQRVEKRIKEGENLSRFEDIHSAIEFMLIEETGPTGQKLATGRSRNELVVTVEKLYLKNKVPAIIESLRRLQTIIVEKAEKYEGIIMPGYTHLRPAQYLLFSHYLLSHFWPIERTKSRLRDAGKRFDQLPLGSGALAGSTVPLDREFLRVRLGFSSVTENSLDAVSDRSFILETLFILALLLLELSRIAEDLVIFSSEEFGLIEFEPGLETSSSLMPQKRNPDVLELVRASCGRLFGFVNGLFVVLKGLPFAYNKDMQEDKIPLHQGVETVLQVLNVFELILKKIKPGRRLQKLRIEAYLIATDLVDYLVARGIPFREAHGIVGEVVKYAEAKAQPLDSLSLAEFQRFSSQFDSEVYKLFNPFLSVKNKKTTGSTNPERVKEQIKRAKEYLSLTW